MKALITNELFSDFIECRYRGYLKTTGASEPHSHVIEVSARLSEAYHSQAREHLLRAYRDAGKQVCTDIGLSLVLTNRYDLAIDVTATDTNASVRFDALMAAPANASGGQPDYIPSSSSITKRSAKKTNCGWHCVLRFSFAGTPVGLRSEGLFMVATSGSGRSSWPEHWNRLTRHLKTSVR